MNFQILDIVIYSFDGRNHKLSFNPGKLNIVTGISNTGKTALIDIIDYCLGSKECEIPDGVIPLKVEWVGIRIQISGGQVFIARKLPSGKKSSYDIYYDIQKKIDIPEYSDLKKTINRDDLINLLSNHAGIGENIHIPPPGQTRPKLVANIRHSLHYCFQRQDEISNRRYLFQKQSNHFEFLAARDTLPYFLGAVVYDYVGKLEKLKQLKSYLNAKKRKLNEFESIKGDKENNSYILLSEAKNYGLFDAELSESWEDSVNNLKLIHKKAWHPEEYEDVPIETNVIEQLRNERWDLMEKFHNITDQLAVFETFETDRKQYSDELDDHLARLKSIELFGIDVHNKCDICPICRSDISNMQIPKINDIKKSFTQLESQMRLVEEKSPQMQKAIRTLNMQLDDIKHRIKEKDEALMSIYATNKKLKKIRDDNIQKTYILGRIGLYLESLQHIEDNSNLKEEIKNIEDEIKIIKAEISEETSDENMEFILSILSKYMNEFASILNLEYAKYPLRFNIKHLTVLADKEEGGPTTMDKMGSAENWLGSHLIAYFALQKWFIKHNRPIPRFLFLDQPSQVYFPSETDFDRKNIEKSEDYNAVKRIYKLAYDIVNELNPHLQIIMTDHADIDEEWFSECVIERWNNKDEGLVPLEWPEKIK